MDILEKMELINFILDKPETPESARKREEFAKLHKSDTLEQFHAKILENQKEL